MDLRYRSLPWYLQGIDKNSAAQACVLGYTLHFIELSRPGVAGSPACDFQA